MESQEEQRSPPPNPPPGLSPLGKLAWQIQLNEYKPTASETAVLTKCFEDGRWYLLNGALVCGAATWNVSGMGRKLKFIPRGIITGVAAVIGSDLGGRIAGYSCMKKIFSLEGSPLRAELISILQEDYPDHFLLKTNPGRSERPLSNSASESEDYAQEAHVPVSSKDWALQIEDSTTKSRDWPEMMGRDNGNDQERSRGIPRIWEIRERKASLMKDYGPDILADPFDVFMQLGVGVDEIGVDEIKDADLKQNDHLEIRRSRMGHKERREYDRRRYEERHAQEERSY